MSTPPSPSSSSPGGGAAVGPVSANSDSSTAWFSDDEIIGGDFDANVASIHDDMIGDGDGDIISSGDGSDPMGRMLDIPAVNGNSSDWLSDFLDSGGIPLLPGEVIAPADAISNHIDGALAQRICSEVKRLGGEFQKQALHVLIGAFPKELEGEQCLHDAIVLLVASVGRLRAHLDSKHLYDLVECYAGAGALSNQFRENGKRVCSFDVMFSPSDDILTPVGFGRAVTALMMTKPGGLLWQGLCCKSFIWVNRKVTKRYKHNRLGDGAIGIAVAGNRMGLRMIILNIIADFTSVDWVVEQPTSSVLHLLPFTEDYLGTAFRYGTWLGAFGATSKKPIKLFTKCSRFSLLCRMRPKSNHFRALYNKTRDGKVHGVKGRMKESEAYSPYFGKAVFKAWSSRRD